MTAATVQEKLPDVPWQSHVPPRWTSKRLRYALSRNEGGVWGDEAEDGTLVLRSTEQTVDGRWKIDDPARCQLSVQERASALLKKGDLVVTKSSGSELHIGKTTIVTDDIERLGCCYSNFMQRLRPVRDCWPKFIYYILNNLIGREQLVYWSNTTTGLANLNGGMIGNILMPFPPLPEQRAIAAFLDRKTAAIDAVIAKKQRMIELLHEKRQALISQAVTKGLDANVKMKDSGIEYIGAIPASWSALPLKRWVAIKITDGPHETPEFVDDGIEFISAEAIQDGVIDFSRRRAYITRRLHDEYCRKCRPQLGDILFCKSGATTGKSAIVTTAKEFSVWSPLALIRADRRHMLGDFLFLAMQSAVFRRQVETRWSYGTQPNIAMSAIEGLWVVAPEVAQQAVILSRVLPALGQIDRTALATQWSIEKLLEYRQAIIAAAVTGKIDVSKEVA